MPSRKLNVTEDEINSLFTGEWAAKYPPLLTFNEVAELFRARPKTVYQWIAQGRFDGACRKRGKRYVFLRNRVMHIYLNDKDWKS